MSGSSFFASLGALTASRVVLVLSQIVILPVIARFLTAEDFGAFALAMSVVIFSQVLSDAGLGRSLIRQPEIDEVEWSSVFWMLTAVGVGLTAALLLTAPLWARVFGLPQLTPLIAVLSVVPFLSALVAIPNARLERDRRFPTLALIRMISALLGLGVAVLLAVRGAGVWALVAQQIVLAVSLCAGGMSLSAFRPRATFSRDGLEQHILFARDTVGTSLLLAFQRQAPLVLIGYFLGAAPLGLFEMARRLLNFPGRGLAGPASQVVYVRMTRALPNLRDVGRIYVTTIRTFALLLIPPMAVLAATGHVVFPTLLSERWLPVANIFLLAAGGFTLEAVASTAGSVMQAAGRTTLRLRMQTERTIFRTLAILLAAQWGIEAVALAISLFVILFLPRMWHFVHQAVPFDRREAARAILIVAGLSIAGCVGLRLLAAQAGFGTWTLLGSAGVVLLGIWLLAGAMLYPALRDDIALLRR